MKIWKMISMCIATAVASVACQTLDIPPKNILNDEDIYNEGGITAYMAGLYNHLPMEDFNMGDDGGRGGFFNWNNAKTTLGNSGEFANHECGNSPAYQDKGYWKPAYQIIRQANTLIQDLPAYIGTLTGTEEWIAEARFVRAYTYFALVKRYGGVPILKEPQPITNDGSALNVARNSHQESVDFILEDLDYAIANMTTKKINGRGNRYVAAAFKSRVALYAGSIARYGSTFDHTVDGVQLTGIPAAKANDYFKQAYDAAVKTEEGGYALHDLPDKRQAFYEVFDKATSTSESIFIREYDINNYVHSWDHMMCPPRMVSSYGGRYFVPLEWVELFDGLPLDPTTGRLKTTDNDGYYIVYDNQHALFDNAEPRLKASIMIPGETYKGVYELDMRSGLIIESVDPDNPTQKIMKTTVDNGTTTYNYDASVNSFKLNDAVVAVRSTAKPIDGQSRNVNGKNVAINGFDGPTTSAQNVNFTGIYGVKWINRTLPTAQTALHRSTQPWIDIRYAEVLLNRAEAAVELAQNGVTTYNTVDMAADAFECINKVRSRAGAVLLTDKTELTDMTVPTNVRGTGINSFVFAPTIGLQHVRVERYKELAIEHKLNWDIHRWFTAHDQIFKFRRRMLAPYLFASTAVVDEETGIPHGKYIFDTRVAESYGGEVTFDQKYYYERIPDVERKVNPLLEQNRGY